VVSEACIHHSGRSDDEASGYRDSHLFTDVQSVNTCLNIHHLTPTRRPLLPSQTAFTKHR
jgi:hypothetical protein